MLSRQLRRVALCLLVVAAVVPSVPAHAQNVDPQSLVGQWTGNWIGASNARHNGKYDLTIETVEGDKVIGKREISGSKDTEAKVNGRLNGNQLTFGKTALTVVGNQMTGTGDRINITLTKEK